MKLPFHSKHYPSSTGSGTLGRKILVQLPNFSQLSSLSSHFVRYSSTCGSYYTIGNPRRISQVIVACYLSRMRKWSHSYPIVASTNGNLYTCEVFGSGGYGADVMEISTCTYMEGRTHVRREILGQDRGGRITLISRNLTFMVP